jgi:hypothetical protein
MSRVRSRDPESRTRISEQKESGASTRSRSRSASRVMSTADTGILTGADGFIVKAL